jgi:hypothetical protein
VRTNDLTASAVSGIMTKEISSKNIPSNIRRMGRW